MVFGSFALNMIVQVNNKVHFPNLDGLRFLCCLVVMVFHFELMKEIAFSGYSSFIDSFHFIGVQDVSLFFVLSGFLIGYLLLKEKQETGGINIKKYYFRRALRIWPLYYLVILLGFLLFPYLAEKWNMSALGINSPYKNIDFILCLLFLQPGTKLIAIGATWSVRVEELFYIFEPLLLKKTKKYLWSFIFITFGVILFRNGYQLLSP
jgi:peptidoglycan/LPS O-acetylase OafA/YrhL